MRRLMTLLFSLMLVVLLSTLALAQTAVSIAPSATIISNPLGTVTAAAGSAATLTLTPSGSQYVYVTLLHVQACASGGDVAAANPTTMIFTGFAPVNPTIQLDNAGQAGVLKQGSCVNQYMPFGLTPLKSGTIGSAVTFPAAGAIANLKWNITAYGMMAP